MSNSNKIISNKCYRNRNGILLNSAFLNVISGNNCSRNDIGIYSYNSSCNNIFNNSISRNSYNGITLQKSHYNFVYRNNISDYNCIGIMIEESYGNIIIGNDIINNEWIGVGLIKTAGNKIHYNNINENRIYGMGGFLCFDNARYNYWGSPLGPGIILNNKLWQYTPFGNPIACFGRVKFFPWRRFPVDDAVNIDKYINKSEKKEIIEIQNITPGIYIFNRKIFSLSDSFIFIDKEGLYTSKFNEEAYNMLMKINEKVEQLNLIKSSDLYIPFPCNYDDKRVKVEEL